MKAATLLSATRLNSIVLIVTLFLFSSCSQPSNDAEGSRSQEVVLGPTPAANQIAKYINRLQNKEVALVVNHTSLVETTHLVDTLLALDVRIAKVFAPEHGFRGDTDAGKHVKDGIDDATGIPILSLYGQTKKPTPGQLENVDLIVFDIQDVGARFYTYISTMHYVMQAAAESSIPVLILDRPNPNGNYVDGPIRKEGFESFVGMHPIPIVHGLTVGELALMINGESWLGDNLTCDLDVITADNYNHSVEYMLPEKPSPNLPTNNSVQWYPSLCLFEGTVMSIGRGTYYPFEVIGFPDSTFRFETHDVFSFKPVSIPGMATYPKHQDQECFGINLQDESPPERLDLSYLIEAYHSLSLKNGEFFNSYFNTLAGTDKLRNQIESGATEVQIRQSWKEELADYQELRKKYLLYPDFEWR